MAFIAYTIDWINDAGDYESTGFSVIGTICVDAKGPHGVFMGNCHSSRQ